MKTVTRCYSQESISKDLVTLGVARGQTLLLHASMRSMGYVEGGAGAIVDTLRTLIGPDGTLVVPTATPNNSDTSRTHLSRVAHMTAYERECYRAAMPAFDPATTPSAGMGVIAETVRTTPGALRSVHPQTSFAALGPRAGDITERHASDCHLGEQSPLAMLYDLTAWILLLGIGYDSCSAFHLAEYRYTVHPPVRLYRCVINRDGKSQWWQYRDVDLDDSDFRELGSDLDQTGIPIRGTVAEAECRLLPLRPAVDFAVEWLRRHRSAP